MKPKYYQQLGVLSTDSAPVLGLLEAGLDGQACNSVTVRTSKKGMTILLDGRRLCSGENAAACIATFKIKQAEANAPHSKK